jgi:hypothetical protein
MLIDHPDDLEVPSRSSYGGISPEMSGDEGFPADLSRFPGKIYSGVPRFSSLEINLRPAEKTPGAAPDKLYL